MNITLPSPLNGLRILDLSRLLPGPYCTMLLADMGAEVIKVETPRVGDYARFLPPDLGLGGMFPYLNRNKRSLALNYRNPQGRESFLRLAAGADVVVESFRPGAVDRWGIGYEAVRAVRPDVIYCSLSGYGQSGPYRDRAGHDLNYIALAGLLGLNGALGGPPIPPGVQIADLSTGMLAAVAILGALVGRAASGRGAYLDVALIDAPVSWVAPTAHVGTRRGAGALAGGLPCFNVYETADGQYLALGALEPDFWAAFLKAVGREDLHPRQFDPGLIPELAGLFRGRTRAEWLELFSGVDACLEPVNSLEAMLGDAHLRQRGLVDDTGIASPVRFAAPAEPHPAPQLGADSEAVLAEAGLSPEEIQALMARGVVRGAATMPPAA